MAYPDQRAKLRYILEQDDQSRSPHYIKLEKRKTVRDKDDPSVMRKEYFQSDFSGNLDMSEAAFTRAYKADTFFAESKIGHHSQYDCKVGSSPVNKSGHGLLVEFLGLDYSIKAIEDFYASFVKDNEADFIACCERLRQGRPRQSAGTPITPDAQRISLASLFARASSEGCALYQRDPVRLDLEEEHEAPVSQLEIGLPVHVELYSPAERDGRTALWKGRSVLLFERNSSGLTRGVLPCLACYPGWKVETFPRDRNLVLPGADAKESTLWKPKAKEVGSYELLFVISEVAPPPEIRDGIIRQALPDTTPELLRLADWIGAQVGVGKAELRKVAYEVVGQQAIGVINGAMP